MRHTLRQLIRHVIVESRLSDAHDRYPEHTELIDSLAGSDPSGNHAYLSWMAKRTVNDSEDANDVIDATIAFHKARGRLQKRDINAYRTLQELRDEVSDVAAGPRSREAAKAGSRTVFDDGHWTAIEVMSPEAACVYGAGTRWCISATRSHNFFKQYSRLNTHFYFIIDRRDAAAKWAFLLVPIDDATKHDEHPKGTLFHRDVARGVSWYAELFDASDRSTAPDAFFASKRQLYDTIVIDITRPTVQLKTQEAQLDTQYKELESAALADLRVLEDPSVPIESIVRFATEYPYTFKLSDRHVARALRNISDSELMYDLLSIDRLSINARGMMKLALHTDPDIRKQVARRSTHADVLEMLVNDDDLIVRQRVAKNTSASTETLDQLANDSDRDTRQNVAKNTSASTETLDRLANNDDPNVRRNVALNASASTKTLDRLANDSDRDVRYGVAINASASTKTLDRLANDGDQDIRHATILHIKNASTSHETLDRQNR